MADKAVIDGDWSKGSRNERLMSNRMEEIRKAAGVPQEIDDDPITINFTCSDGTVIHYKNLENTYPLAENENYYRFYCKKHVDGFTYLGRMIPERQIRDMEREGRGPCNG